MEAQFGSQISAKGAARSAETPWAQGDVHMEEIHTHIPLTQEQTHVISAL